ncbi:MAG TPA: hypothetical protein VFO69_12690 [Allosphingosinicella sp.]|nr:hypothetical protein [Allosphingosinicella sp.]
MALVARMLGPMLLAAGARFGAFGLFAAVHPAIIVAVGAAAFAVRLVLALLMLALVVLTVLLVTLLMLAVCRAVLLVLLVLGMALRLGRRGLRRRGGSDY